MSYIVVEVSPTSGTMPSTQGRWNQIQPPGLTVITGVAVPSTRFSLASSAIIYLVASGSWTGGTSVKASGYIQARRVR